MPDNHAADNNSVNLPSFSQLNDVYLIKLSQLSAITLAGEEQSKYLQGQVTCDVNTLAEQHLLTGAHCDAKGKVFTVFRLFNRQSAHFLLQTSSSVDKSLTELSKFGVFAKVNITKASSLSVYALGGKNSTQTLSKIFKQIPDSLTPVIHIDTLTVIYLAGQTTRYLLIDDHDLLESCVDQIQSSAKSNINIYPKQVWDLLEIAEGFPQLNNTSAGQYVPQMLNVDKINGISFTKGCYLGQETVARMQYLGKNKRALYALEGPVTDNLADDDVIEKQLGENWRKAGDTLSSYQASDGTCYIQAVLANDSHELTLRVKSQPNSRLSVRHLPYPTTNDG